MGRIISVLVEILRFCFVFVVSSFLIFTLVFFSPKGWDEIVQGEINQRDFFSFLLDYAGWMKNLLINLNLGYTKEGDDVFIKVLFHFKNSFIIILIAIMTSVILSFFIRFLFHNLERKILLRKLANFIFDLVSAIPVVFISYLIFRAFQIFAYPGPFSLEVYPFWFYCLIPGLIMGIGDGFLSEFSRLVSSEISSIKQESYVKFAVAKGANLWRHIKYDFFIHAFRLLSTRFVILLSGTVIVEFIFGVPGIGKLVFDATESRDTNLILGVVVLATFLVCFFNFTSRLIRVWIDPRYRG
jgi:ABC-type dipeptide/oligopeptide/nickel transport system permease component